MILSLPLGKELFLTNKSKNVVNVQSIRASSNKCRFVLCSASQIYGGDFAKFCGLLRRYELYHRAANRELVSQIQK